MAKNGADIEADIKTAEDRGETVSLMEPILIGEGSRHRAELTDLALDLAQKSAGFRRSLPESLVTSLADLVRSMNCYYSNLIEGHDTHPIEIERAQRRLQQGCQEAGPPTGSASAHRGPALDRRWWTEGPRDNG